MAPVFGVVCPPPQSEEAKLDIDIILEPDLTPQQIKELGVAAEQLGIRALWTSNYFAHWDCFLSLAPLALETERLLMGPLAVSPFEMHPLKIANALLTLNELSNGRAQIAMGAGEGNLEAMALDKPQKVVLAIREAIEIVRGAGRGALKGGYDGEIFNVNLPCAYDVADAAGAARLRHGVPAHDDAHGRSRRRRLLHWLHPAGSG